MSLVGLSGDKNVTMLQAVLDTIPHRPPFLFLDRIDEVRTLPVERLIEAAGATDPILGGSLYFGPVLDFRTLPRHPFYPDAAPLGRSIPMIIGNTREETLGFMGNDPKNVGLTWETLKTRLSPGVMRIDITPEAVIAGYRAMHPEWSPDQVLIAATTIPTMPDCRAGTAKSSLARSEEHTSELQSRKLI